MNSITRLFALSSGPLRASFTTVGYLAACETAALTVASLKVHLLNLLRSYLFVFLFASSNVP